MFIKSVTPRGKTYHYLTRAFRDASGQSRHQHLANLDQLDKEELDGTIAELTRYREERFGRKAAPEAIPPASPTFFQKILAWITGLFRR